MPGTILFGVDVESCSESSAGYCRYATELFHDLQVPATWYVTGMTLEKYPREFQEVAKSSLIELESHTYSHMLLKTALYRSGAGPGEFGAKEVEMVRGGSIEQLQADLGRAQRVFQDVLGRTATALTGPWGYYRGLADRPDVLEVVYAHGFRILRTCARCEADSQPVPLEWRPFWYEAQGFPDVLECLIHDFQDDYLWREFGRPAEGERYADHLKRVANRVAAEDLVWSVDTHDHGCETREGFERKGTWMRELLTHAKGLGIRFLKITDYHAEMSRSR
jgi:peptidoglycan/xylan/chitin deacetylase (PgdA/CDA1 family)